MIPFPNFYNKTALILYLQNCTKFACHIWIQSLFVSKVINNFQCFLNFVDIIFKIVLNWHGTHAKYFVNFFSSPEPKAHLSSFPDNNLSVVRRLRCCRCSCLHRCRKLFTFWFSLREPMGQFQPNLVQSILGWSGFMFVQMKDHVLFKEGDNSKRAKLYWQNF